MRIACLQFAPQVGDVDNNLNRADAVLSKANPQNLDLLVLPELAFSGYNFNSLEHITPYLEPTTSGITSLWARTTALKHNCVVTVGYPEKVTCTSKRLASPEYYNSAITVNSEGETIANYRKSFLYYTDETWAMQGPDGFYGGSIDGLGDVAMGICMDLNPYKFQAPWNAWEFAYHILHRQANLVILSMAWVTREDPSSFSQHPKEPDMDTLSYWLSRLEPIIRAETVGEIIVVLANRTGAEGDVTYAGSSAVLGIQRGEVRVYGILGRGEKELLVVDTDRRPHSKLVSEPNSSISRSSAASSTGTSRSKAGTKDSNSSTGLEPPTPMPKDSTQDNSSTVDPIYETHEVVGMGLGLGASVDTAGDQISVLSPITNSSPDTPRAPTELRSNEDLFAQSLLSRYGRKRCPSDFSEDGPRRPESPKSRNVSRAPRESRLAQDGRSESRPPRQRRNDSTSPCVSEASFQYPELPPSRNASRSPPHRSTRADSKSPTTKRNVSISPGLIETTFQYPPLPPSRNASRSPRESRRAGSRSSSKRRDTSAKPVQIGARNENLMSLSLRDGDQPQRESRSMQRRSSSKVREPRSSQSRSGSKIRDPSATPFLRQSRFKAVEPPKSRHASRPPKLSLESRQSSQSSSSSGHLTIGEDNPLMPRFADGQNIHQFGSTMSLDAAESPNTVDSPDSAMEEFPVVLQDLAAKLIFGSYGLSDSPIARILSNKKKSTTSTRPLATPVQAEDAKIEEIKLAEQKTPRSASALQENYQTFITIASFGPRSEHALRRSRSSMW